MTTSFRIGRLFGIDVKVHVTFALILLWAALLELRSGGAVADALTAVLFVLALFLCVVLHEMGHALMARRFGVETRDIVLLPIGGVARLSHIPEAPAKELLIAIAGPVVNVILAALLFGGLAAAGQPFVPDVVEEAPRWTALSFVSRVLFANLMLFFFNLVPAFPMDGGRILRALLATQMSRARATAVAARVGRLLAGVAIVLGVASGNPMLILVALFVWIAGAAEASAAALKERFAGVPVSRVMQTDFDWLGPGDTLARAAELTLAGSQRHFPVVDGDTLVGLLTQRGLVRGLAKEGPMGSVAAAMQTDISVAEASDRLEPLLREPRLLAGGAVPVLRSGRLEGLLTDENVREYTAIEDALQQHG